MTTNCKKLTQQGAANRVKALKELKTTPEYRHDPAAYIARFDEVPAAEFNKSVNDALFWVGV